MIVDHFSTASNPILMPTPRAARAMASAWTPYEKNTLRGFFDLELPSGLIIHGCTLHVKGDSKWVGLPAQKVVRAGGEVGYVAILEFTNHATADRFRDLAIDALRELGAQA
jgi:thiosulfate reductase cytochrome b subunit